MHVRVRSSNASLPAHIRNPHRDFLAFFRAFSSKKIMNQSNFHNDKLLLRDYILGKFPTKAQKKAIIACSSDVHRLLDVTSVLPHLYAKGLLSDEEFEVLSSPYLTRQHKINTLLKGLPLKGSDFLDKFIQCLHETEDGTGHKELIDLLFSIVLRESWVVQHRGKHCMDGIRFWVYCIHSKNRGLKQPSNGYLSFTKQ